MNPILLASLALLLTGRLFSFQNAGASIHGRVLGIGSKPVEQVTVHLQQVETGMIWALTAQADGQYQFADLPPGEYKVTLSSYLFHTETIQAVLLRPGQALFLPVFELDSEGIMDCSTDLRPLYYSLMPHASDTGAISGIILDGEGQAVPHADVRLFADGKQTSLAQTDSAGHFLMNNVSGRRDYRLVIERSGFFTEITDKLSAQDGFSATYRPITLEACRSGSCRSYLKEIRVLPGCL